jgi:hypothetical protein
MIVHEGKSAARSYLISLLEQPNREVNIFKTDEHGFVISLTCSKASRLRIGAAEQESRHKCLAILTLRNLLTTGAPGTDVQIAILQLTYRCPPRAKMLLIRIKEWQTHKMATQLRQVLLKLWQWIPRKVNVIIKAHQPFRLDMRNGAVTTACNTIILAQFDNAPLYGCFTQTSRKAASS